jgi:hypothetical protein
MVRGNITENDDMNLLAVGACPHFISIIPE